MALSGGSNGAMGEAEEQTLFTRQGAHEKRGVGDLDVGFQTNKWVCPKIGVPPNH